jgi:4'-phosphopantetheinyl transferase
MDYKLAGAVLSDGEHSAWTAFPAQSRAAALVAWWTRKEAVLKATGHGLVVDPRKIVVAPPNQPPALTEWLADCPSPGPIQLHELSPGSGYAASLATLGPHRLEIVEADGRTLLERYLKQVR